MVAALPGCQSVDAMAYEFKPSWEKKKSLQRVYHGHELIRAEGKLKYIYAVPFLRKTRFF